LLNNTPERLLSSGLGTELRRRQFQATLEVKD
jgi:hypothetical protein